MATLIIGQRIPPFTLIQGGHSCQDGLWGPWGYWSGAQEFIADFEGNIDRNTPVPDDCRADLGSYSDARLR